MPAEPRPIRACARGLLVLSLWALPLAAGAEELTRTFPSDIDTVVEVRNLNGRVDIHAWDQQQVKVVARRRTRAVEIHLNQAGNYIHIDTHLLQSSAAASERVVDYEVWAPPDANLKIHLDAGTLLVENFSDEVTVETVAATVVLRHLSGYTSVQTLNGSLEAERISGRLEATSISGSLRFQGMDTRYLVAKTTSGDIYYEGDFRPGGSYEFVNHEGSIELLIAATASFELDANAVKGEVMNEFPLTPRSHGRQPRGSVARSLLGTVHSGAAMVRVTSFSGTIRLRKF